MVSGLVAAATAGHVLYPAWLAWRTRGGRGRASTPPGTGEPQEAPDLTVLVPAYREAGVIAAKIEDIRANGYPGELEILVVADGDPETAAAADASRRAGADRTRSPRQVPGAQPGLCRGHNAGGGVQLTPTTALPPERSPLPSSISPTLKLERLPARRSRTTGVARASTGDSSHGSNAERTASAPRSVSSESSPRSGEQPGARFRPTSPPTISGPPSTSLSRVIAWRTSRGLGPSIPQPSRCRPLGSGGSGACPERCTSCPAAATSCIRRLASWRRSSGAIVWSGTRWAPLPTPHSW